MLTAILILSILGLLLWKLSRKPDKFPPGPPRWPIVGNLLQFKMAGRQPHFVVQDLRKKYGKVVGCYLSSAPLIIVSGLSEIKEMLTKPDFQGRPIGAVAKMENERLGVILNDGDSWRDQRRFSLRHLRELGLGKREMETLIHEEIRAMINEAKRLAGPELKKPVPVREVIKASGANVILHLLAGYRFERTDPRLAELMEIIKKVTTLSDATGGIANSFPFMLKYFPSLTEYPTMNAKKDEVKEYCKDMIVKHQKVLDEGNPSDLMDYYLLEMKKFGENASFNMRQLIGLSTDLFLAGSDTTSGALSYAILYSVTNPRVQVKIQEELDAVVGRERLPSLDDKAKLLYVEATILETLRISTIAPLAVPHAPLTTATDLNFRGYVIPKESRILINLYDLHNDRQYWGDPDVFRPERFLDKDGKLRKEDALLPFGFGKRSCLGESMARNNLFLTFTALLQSFSFKLPTGAPAPSIEPEGAFTLTAQPFDVIIVPRS